eukprot:914164-Rhodomonas_salina.1
MPPHARARQGAQSLQLRLRRTRTSRDLDNQKVQILLSIPSESMPEHGGQCRTVWSIRLACRYALLSEP